MVDETFVPEVKEKVVPKKDVPKKASNIWWLFGFLMLAGMVFTLLVLVRTKVLSGAQVFWGFFSVSLALGLVLGIANFNARLARKSVLEGKVPDALKDEVEAQNFILERLCATPDRGGFMFASADLDLFNPSSLLNRGVEYLGKNNNVKVFRLIIRNRHSGEIYDCSVRADNRDMKFQRFVDKFDWVQRRAEADEQVNRLAGFNFVYSVKKRTYRDVYGSHEEEEKIPVSLTENEVEKKVEGELK